MKCSEVCGERKFGSLMAENIVSSKMTNWPAFCFLLVKWQNHRVNCTPPPYNLEGVQLVLHYEQVTTWKGTSCSDTTSLAIMCPGDKVCIPSLKWKFLVYMNTGTGRSRSRVLVKGGGSVFSRLCWNWFFHPWSRPNLLNCARSSVCSRGPAEFWPRRGPWAQIFWNRGFSLKIAWKVHD